MENKTNNLIAKYLKIIEIDPTNTDELYKWDCINHFQENWNLDSDDFNKMFSKALAKRENLIYQTSFWFLSKCAELFPGDAIDLFTSLYDETLSFEERYKVHIAKSNVILEKLKKELNNDNRKHQQDERTLSFLLMIRYPEKYYLYKDNVYKALCYYLNVKSKKAGEKFMHFQELAENEINTIVTNESLIAAAKKFIPTDTNFDYSRILFQDIIYQTLVLTKQKEKNIAELLKIALDVKKQLDELNHPLSSHNWKENEAMYQQVSIFENEDISFLHYELMPYKDGYAWEFHPEGNREKKTIMRDFVYGYDRAYKRIHWKPNISRNYKTGEFFKIVPKIKVPITIKSDTYEESIKQLANQFIKLYDSTNDRLKKYIQNPTNNNQTISTNHTEMAQPLNQILFGPPGTGKTYNSINKALEIIIPNEYEKIKDDRKAITKRFRELQFDEKHNPNGRIVFTTFHQSMSYEDFIEGIKPDLENGELSYTIKDGIFKQIVSKAIIKSDSNFDKVYSNFLSTLNENSNEKIVLLTKTKSEYRVNVNSNNNLNLYTSKEINKQGVLSKAKLEKYFNGEENVYDGWEGYAEGVIKHLQEKYGLIKIEEQISENNNYLIIIDEINRGNVSSIFGELITLIEDDKRLTELNELNVTLPYSKETFSVPPNLYILGTMNTADRSVESLDSALRRRFSFEEMAPQHDLISVVGKLKDKKGIIDKINLVLLLKTINKRIEKLIDKDHKIGHSYFLKIEDLQGLKDVFHKNIIPLLQEYFFGDFGKIGLVIGSGFYVTREKEIEDDKFFATVNDYDFGGLHEKKIYDFVNVAKMDDTDFTKAIDLLLGK